MKKGKKARLRHDVLVRADVIPTLHVIGKDCAIEPDGADDLQDESDGSTNAVKLTMRIGLGDIPLSATDLSALYGTDQTDPQSEIELVWITAPTVWLALRTYQGILLDQLEDQVETQEPQEMIKVVPHRPDAGWYSWNEHFEEIDEALIADHIERVDTLLAPSDLRLIEVDDGWQQGWGIWEENDRFPNGLQPLIEDATRRGLTFGIWMAPFLVDQEIANLYDPTLFVHRDGAPLEHTIIGNPRTYYVLDTSHPDAMSIAVEPLRRLANQGVTFFKLDFLYAAALPGDRAQPITGTEALRYGLSQIRDAIGADATLNGCGAPVHAMLGYADSLRIGADTTFGDLYPSFLASAARSLAARAYLYPMLWPDGDQTQLREPYSDEEAYVSALSAALAGAAYSIGDDLVLLPEDRLSIALSNELLIWANAPKPARPVDLMEYPAASVYPNPLIDAIQNPGGTGAIPPKLFENIDMDGNVIRAYFQWDRGQFSAESSSLSD